MDDFESTPSGAFPSNWTRDANAWDGATNGVVSLDGTKALQLHGAVGSCWAALTYRPTAISGPFVVKAEVWNGAERLTGCHPDRAGIGLRQGTSWTQPERNFLSFHRDGNIRTGGGANLLPYQTERWYDVEVRYEPLGSTVRLTYVIDGTLRHTETLPAGTSEPMLTHLELHAQEGTVRFDNVSVRPLSVRPPIQYVLIHGVCSSSALWGEGGNGQAVTENLSADGLPPVAVDWRPRPGEGAEGMISQVRAQVRSILDRTAPDAQVVLVGHSMGGLIARALLAGPTLTARIARVVTLDAPDLGLDVRRSDMLKGGSACDGAWDLLIDEVLRRHGGSSPEWMADLNEGPKVARLIYTTCSFTAMWRLKDCDGSRYLEGTLGAPGLNADWNGATILTWGTENMTEQVAGMLASMCYPKQATPAEAVVRLRGHYARDFSELVLHQTGTRYFALEISHVAMLGQAVSLPEPRRAC